MKRLDQINQDDIKRFLKKNIRLVGVVGIALVAIIVVVAVNANRSHSYSGYGGTSFTEAGSDTSGTSGSGQDTDTSGTGATPTTPQTVEQAFPGDQQLTMGESQTAGIFTYKLLSLNTNYIDPKLNSYLKNLNAYASSGVLGTSPSPQVETLAAIQITNNSSNPACLNISTQCPTESPAIDFGCIAYGTNFADLTGNPASDLIFNDTLAGTVGSSGAFTYPVNSDSIPVTVVQPGSSTTEYLEIDAACTDLGNASGTSYWKID